MVALYDPVDKGRLEKVEEAGDQFVAAGRTARKTTVEGNQKKASRRKSLRL